MTHGALRHVVGRHPVRKLMLRKADGLISGPPTVRAAASVIVTATAGVVVVWAVAMRIFDPSEFPNIWRSLWWSMQTATTVGYGDVTPHDSLGRVVAAFVMLEGIAVLAVVTASITSVFVARAQRQLRGDEPWRQVLARLDDLDRRLDELQARNGRSPSSHDVRPGAMPDAPPTTAREEDQ